MDPLYPQCCGRERANKDMHKWMLQQQKQHQSSATTSSNNNNVHNGNQPFSGQRFPNTIWAFVLKMLWKSILRRYVMNPAREARY
ncbi:hypothetical protein DPMN_135914 [Dreissena polymorpha]|uniref:Uncharacterized protein n=1 Tax=Dreissena polymorpha TaxID=45954 RepID=A0A9D4G1T2_DREPO|nr:hypothetical protein DPMN_135914 [Dreissena polymorpha]